MGEETVADFTARLNERRATGMIQGESAAATKFYGIN
jgi:hypothetical protein